MLPLNPHRTGRRIRAGIAFGLLIFALGALVLRGAPAWAQGHPMSGSHAHGSMSSDDMKRWVQNWFSTHPVVGLTPTAGAVDTFIAGGTSFDTDHNPGTVVDTAKILTGQTIMWRATSGSHTVTNGTSSVDPNVGTLFDAPIDFLNTPEFTFTFNAPGTYPFFCRPHEFFNMKGVVVVTDAAPVDTFDTNNLLQYDADHDTGTPVDTVVIQVGDKVMWRAIGPEFHTVTNGVSRFDTTAGKIFDVPLDPSHLTFTFQFNEAGQFPFFCRPHEEDGMRGVVVVGTPVAVGPRPTGKRIGFASEPAPNPTTGSVSFRVSLPEGGRATARVFDVRGQLIAVPLNQELGAGAFDVRWNGTTRTGGRAAPGVYYIKLSIPGFTGTRRIVLTI